MGALHPRILVVVGKENKLKLAQIALHIYLGTADDSWLSTWSLGREYK